MLKVLKTVVLIVVMLLLGIGGYQIWKVNINHNFETITEGKVYKSGLIPPDKIASYLSEHKIKTVVDLLDPGVQDALNPAKQEEIDAEAKAVLAYNLKNKASVRHVNIPSPQVPTKKTLTKFFEVMDDPENYPVLIHCYHGEGRAPLYSALYRIEYEQWSNEEARSKTRFFLDSAIHRSSFAKGREKGDFLLGYRPRSDAQESTLQRLSH